MPPDLALRSRRLVTPEGLRDGAVLIEDAVIAGIVSPEEVPGDCPVEDVGEAVVMAGLVDSHVHVNEPGRTHWEGFETATRAAAAGGITTLVDMPLNSVPVTTTQPAFDEKLRAADGKLWVDCGFYAGLIPGSAPDLEPLLDAGVLGVKAFLVHSGIDEFPNATEADLRAAMPLLARRSVPLLVHAELDLGAPAWMDDPRSYAAYLASRPRAWENEAIALLIDLCRAYRARVHVVHLSSSDAVPLLRAARAEGLPLTVETCPHYLCFAAETIPDGDTRFKCAPPIRERANREHLWAALRDGVLDFVVSDHSPAPPALKLLDAGDFRRAWGGIASLQLGLPAVWTAARARGFAVTDLARWMGQGPARFLGLEDRKGVLAAGRHADLVVWNPEATFTVEPSKLHHRHKPTPYAGQQLCGVVEKTLLRGKTVYERGRFADEPGGRPLFGASAPPGS